MRIRAVGFNNRKKGFDVSIGKRSFWYPYARLETRPSRQDPVVRVSADAELGREGFTYALASGQQGTVHIDQVREYNQDPAYLRDLLLYKLTVEAQDRVKRSQLSRREIIRRLRTSPAQFYRLLDQANRRKSLDQVISLLNVLDCDVDFSIHSRAGASLARDRRSDMEHRKADNSEIIQTEDGQVRTLRDILPEHAGLRVLFVGKSPSPTSAEVGHYFRGKMGKMFWRRLQKYDMFHSYTEYEDDSLLKHDFGITDVAKVPRAYGERVSNKEYQKGIRRILTVIRTTRPLVVVFVYKQILDKMLQLEFGVAKRSRYGFNPEHDERVGAKVFAFPMPATRCNTADADKAMRELAKFLKEN